MIETDTLQCINGRTDYHDIRLLDDGGYILQCYDSIWVELGLPFPQLLKDILVIQEFDQDDNLILNWNALDHLSIDDYPNINLSYPEITFMHGNSIEIDDDENLLLSNRTSNEVFKIDRLTGDIIWIMGGPLNEFTFIDDPLNGFNKQHDVRRINNGNITLFDNGTQHSPMVSRAVEYEIDEINKTAQLVWAYNHPDSIVSMSMGSVQRLPNQNTLINWGFFFETIIMDVGTLIMEVDYDKNIIFELIYPQNIWAYRARKSDWDFSINVIKGDSNLDDIVNVVDVIYLLNYILYDNHGNPNLFIQAVKTGVVTEVEELDHIMNGKELRTFPEKQTTLVNEIIEYFNKNNKTKIALFGASALATSIISILDKKQIKKIVAVFDNDIDKKDKELHRLDLPISVPSNFNPANYDSILITTYFFDKEIHKQLIAKDCPKEKIVSINDFVRDL